MKTEMRWMQYSENMTPVGFDFPRNSTIFSNGSNTTAFTTIFEESSPKNSSVIDEDSDEILDDYIFDRTDVRAIFITLYTIVFCCCFFGNLLVILVVTLSRRLRSITNFFLANLALADLCVGLFCVFQNLSLYLVPSWIFGDFLCKMYQFIHSLSYTASIFILVVICTERYFAIIHPITCKQILTPNRLRLVIVGVWITSALYSAPKFIWVQTITNELEGGMTETICINHRKKYDAELFDMINFGLLYVIPLCVMTVLYTRIAVGLWRSAKGIERRVVQNSSNNSANRCGGTNCTTHCATGDVQVSVDVSNNYSPLITTWRARSVHNTDSHFSHLSQKVLRARRGVIRMLIVVVLTFALCNLPFHARKMWQHWSSNYHGGSDFSTLLTPLTFLISYFNSGINPFLYAFLSRNFRKGMRELLFCSCKRSQSHQQGHLLYAHQSSNNQHHSMLRRSSTRSTRAPGSTTTVATNVTDT